MGTVRLRPNPEMQRRMQLQRCVCGDDAALCRITLDTSSVIKMVKMDGFTATQSRNHDRVTAVFSAFVALANLRYINAINNNNNNNVLQWRYGVRGRSNEVHSPVFLRTARTRLEITLQCSEITTKA